MKELSDSSSNEPKKSPLVDSTLQNKYGDLLNDDSLYKKKVICGYPYVKCLQQIPLFGPWTDIFLMKTLPESEFRAVKGI